MIAVHLAVLLFGLSGLFGKALPLSAIAIVWWRTGFATPALLSAGALWGQLKRPSRADSARLIALGLVLAAHWVTFFEAIQRSTVAIGLLTFSAFPVFVVFLEPWVLKEKLRRSAVARAALAVLGVALVVPEPNLQSAHTQGALWGLLSGALYAVLTVSNRRLTEHHSAMTIGLWQNAAAFVALSYFAWPQALEVDRRSLALLMVLGVVFTGGAHALFIHGMRKVSASTASLIGALEPVYGVLAAALLLAEVPKVQTLLGGGLIVLAVALASAERSDESSERPVPQ